MVVQSSLVVVFVHLCGCVVSWLLLSGNILYVWACFEFLDGRLRPFVVVLCLFGKPRKIPAKLIYLTLLDVSLTFNI